MEYMKKIVSGLAAAFLIVSCTMSSPIQNVIIDTDLGNDVDDALAMDLAWKYVEDGRINLLGYCLSKGGTAPAEYADIVNTFYGYPDTPVGIIRNGADPDNGAPNFAKTVAGMKDELGRPLFQRSISDYEALPEATLLYRKLLSGAADKSVDIVSIGFSTNLQRLLETGSDEYSELSGRELVAKKVNRLVMMAGNFIDPEFCEFNVRIDVEAARSVFEQWPTPIITSPFELGKKTCYPATSIENDFTWTEHHPVVEAYKVYKPMPHDRPMWDPTALLYAVEGDKYFSLSPVGDIKVSQKGTTSFVPNPNGRCRYLIADKHQSEAMVNYFVNVISRKPQGK